MSALTETTKREFSKRILEVMNSNSSEFQAVGLDISFKSTELSANIDEAFSAEERQLKAQADAHTATVASQEATEAAYKSASSAVELMVGALGKDNSLSKRLRNMRDEISNEELRGKRNAAANAS